MKSETGNHTTRRATTELMAFINGVEWQENRAGSGVKNRFNQ
jgi:hypothetical protein